MRIPRWIRRESDRQLRAVIVTQQVALYNKERECREWQRIAERHAADLVRLTTPTSGTIEAVQVAFWREKAEQLLEDLRILQNPSWTQ
jgi:hypothetical protein